MGFGIFRVQGLGFMFRGFFLVQSSREVCKRLFDFDYNGDSKRRNEGRLGLGSSLWGVGFQSRHLGLRVWV